MKDSDVYDFFSWASDDRITKYLQWNTINTKEVALKILKEIAIPQPLMRSTCLRDKSIKFLLAMPEIVSDGHRAHMAYALGTDFWGGGITTETVKMAIPLVLQEFPYVVRIEAFVDDENKGSQRVLEKAGFTREGYLRKYGFNKSEIRDEIF